MVCFNFNRDVYFEHKIAPVNRTFCIHAALRNIVTSIHNVSVTLIWPCMKSKLKVCGEKLLPEHWTCRAPGIHWLASPGSPCFSGCNTAWTLHWRHNDHNGVSNHQLHGCLLNRLFGRRSKKTSKLRVTGLCVGNSPGPVNSPHKGPVTRKMFPFDDVIMNAMKTRRISGTAL